METIRDVTKEECQWLDDTIKKGTEVFEYTKCTYGCVSPQGVAVTLEEGKEPFIELPKEALKCTWKKNK